MVKDDKTTPEIQITTIEQGRDELAKIQLQMTDLMYQLQHEDSIPAWNKLSSQRYNLKLKRRAIQAQMVKLVKSRRDARAAMHEDDFQQDGST